MTNATPNATKLAYQPPKLKVVKLYQIKKNPINLRENKLKVFVFTEIYGVKAGNSRWRPSPIHHIVLLNPS